MTTGVAVWSLTTALDAVDDPDLDRRVGAAVGIPGVVVEIDRPPDTGESARLGALAERLRRLPVVAIAAVADPPATAGSGPAGDDTPPAGFDLVCTDPGPVARGVADHPHAAVVAAQLLRRRGERPGEGLLLESLAYATLQAGSEHAAWLATRGRRVRRDADAPRVRLDDEGDRWHVTLARPHLRNLVDASLRDALVDALRVVTHDPHRRPVLLDGEGPVFCAGGDPAEFGTCRDPTQAHLVRAQANVAPWLLTLADRLTVEVHGAAVGAGVEMAAFAHRVRAREDTRFRLPEITLGLVPGAGGTVSITRRIGRRRTLWWLLTDTTVDTTTAHAWGLVDAVVPAGSPP